MWLDCAFDLQARVLSDKAISIYLQMDSPLLQFKKNLTFRFRFKRCPKVNHYFTCKNILLNPRIAEKQDTTL